MRSLVCAAALVLGGTVAAQPASLEEAAASRSALTQAASFPDGFYVEDAVGSAFNAAMTVAFAPGGRMFVIEKRGMVWVVENGVLQTTPFLDIRDEVLNQQDRGLLGLAIDPDFETNRRVYLSYTVDHDPTVFDERRLDAFNRVTRYAGRADNPNVADPASRTVLIGQTFSTGIPSCHYSHSIGTLQFGSDGTLLIGAGDGASYNTMDDGGRYPACFGPGKLDASEDIGSFRSLRVESLAGKILRIDPETGLGLPSNPFYTGDAADTASKVWALGFRNPWRFTVQPGGSTDPADGDPGVIYLGDVGWRVWEEMNVVRAGENHGWPCREGARPHPEYVNGTPATNGCSVPFTGVLTDPSYEWHHSDATRSTPSGRTARAVYSGDVYSGNRYPAFYRGAVFYGDYPNGWIAAARPDGSGQLTQDRLFSPDFGPVGAIVYDPVSELHHIVSLSDGRIYRLRHVDEAQNSVPVAAAGVMPSQGGTGTRFQFSPEGSFDPDGDALTYSWTLGDGTTSTERAPGHVYGAPGLYTATVEISDGIDTATQSTTVKVRAGSRPSVEILSPTRDLRATAGTPVRLEAIVSDPDQAASTLSVQWSITQVHENHIHPDVFVGSGRVTQFTPVSHGDDDELYYYRIRVAVRDATGLESIDERPLFFDGSEGEADVTTAGAPFALGTSANGYPVSRIRDGVMPEPGVVDYTKQFDSYESDDGGRVLDGVGYTFEDTLRFTRVTFQEGMHYLDGGWFETIGVQVRENGTWRDVVGLEIAPEYRATDGSGYDIYEMSFAPTEGDAIRVVGRPSGSATFISVGEMRAWAVEAGDAIVSLPDGWAAADIGAVPTFGSALSPAQDAFTVTGSGDVWGERDAFHFVSREMAGDGTLTARVTALSTSPDWAKAGLVVRASDAPGAPYVGVMLSNLGAHHQVRTDEDTATDGPIDLWGRSAPTWLRVERVGTSVTTSVSDDGATWTAIRTSTVPALTGPVRIGMTASSADLDGTQTATATFRDVSLGATLPAPWAARDIGTPALPGSAEATTEGFRIIGSGDLWGTQDAAHLVHQPLNGDGSVVAEVTRLDGAADWARGSVVIRSSLDAGAPYAGIAVTNLGVHLQYRPDPGSPTAGVIDIWGVEPPVWLRLDREGTSVASYYSLDGSTWEGLGTVSVPGLTASAVAGISTSASSQTATAEAEFENVSVSAGAPPIAGLQAAPLFEFGVEPIFPNPTSSWASVRVVLAEAGPVRVEVLDVLGRRIRDDRVEASEGILDLGLDLRGQPAGTYIVRVTAADEVRTQTFTVAR